MLKLITISIILVSCGQLPDQQAQPEKAQILPDVSASEEVADTTEAPEIQSLYLEKKEELWPCTKELNRQLVYVLEEGLFYVCQKNDWVKVEIKGEDGEDGADGHDGADGKDGARGEKGDKGEKGDRGDQGLAGVKGSDGKVTTTDNAPSTAPRQLMDNEWIDPVTNMRWFTGRIYSWFAVSQVTQLCPAGSISPSEGEVAQASLSGLFNRFGEESSLWIASSPQGGKAVLVAESAGVNQGAISIKNPAHPNANSTLYKTLCIALE